MHAVYNGIELSDNFQIQVTNLNPHSKQIPALREVGGRTQSIANKWKITDLRSLHHNIDGTACVCVKQVEQQKFPPGSSLMTYIEELVVPYLYSLAYFEQHQRWPWGDYSHGVLGLLEFYAGRSRLQSREELDSILPNIRREKNWQNYHKQLRKPSPEKQCLCGSGKAFRSCHPRVWDGLLHLSSEMRRIGVEPRGLFSNIK